jgi:hypothetical protein
MPRGAEEKDPAPFFAHALSGDVPQLALIGRIKTHECLANPP